jgi:hypothetical protein
VDFCCALSLRLNTVGIKWSMLDCFIRCRAGSSVCITSLFFARNLNAQNVCLETAWDNRYIVPPGSIFEIYDSFGDGICCGSGNGDFDLIITGWPLPPPFPAGWVETSPGVLFYEGDTFSGSIDTVILPVLDDSSTCSLFATHLGRMDCQNALSGSNVRFTPIPTSMCDFVKNDCLGNDFGSGNNCQAAPCGRFVVTLPLTVLLHFLCLFVSKHSLTIAS